MASLAPPPPPFEGDKSVGIIFPPADIRGTIDKTAAYVANNGVQFEQRIVQQQSAQRFAFLNFNSPYRPYYDMKVKEFQTGESIQSVPSVPKAILDMKKKEEEKKKKKEHLLMLTQHGEKSDTVQPPDPDEFSIVHPVIAPVDVDVIKLTAQFVARNGQNFLIGLTQRERDNRQFEFLQPTHHLFKYFTSLVDSYTKCLLPEKTHIEKLQRIISQEGRGELLQKMFKRYDWDAEQERIRLEKEKAADEERAQMQNIDWHDFVIVESIQFTEEDQQVDLPPPVDFSGRGPRVLPPPLAQQSAGAVVEKSRRMHAGGDESAMEIEEAVDPAVQAPRLATAPAAIESEPAVSLSAQTTPAVEPPSFAPPIAQPIPPASQIPEGVPEVLVVRDYKRPARRRAEAAGAELMYQKCPITGQKVLASEMGNHLRILLLDPKWKEQKDMMLDRAKKESAFAPEFDVETNLAQFVARRPDLFGSVEDEIQVSTAEDEGSLPHPVGYDPSRGSTNKPPGPALPPGVALPPSGPLPPPEAKRQRLLNDNSNKEA